MFAEDSAFNEVLYRVADKVGVNPHFVGPLVGNFLFESSLVGDNLAFKNFSDPCSGEIDAVQCGWISGHPVGC